jgi:hypothetical protein
MPYSLRKVDPNENRPLERCLSLLAENGADQMGVIEVSARAWAREQRLDMRVCEEIWSEAR